MPECDCVSCASDRAPTRALSRAIKEQWSSTAGDALHLNEGTPSDTKNAEKTHLNGSRGVSNTKVHNGCDNNDSDNDNDNDDDEVGPGFDPSEDYTGRVLVG